MFDLSIYIGPIIVLVVMLFSVIGFAVWGGRDIREYAEHLAEEKAASRAPKETPLAPTVAEPAEETSGLDLLTENPATDLENTAEFSQPSFAQSFLEGKEIPVPGLDFDAVIDRITADLNAAEAIGVPFFAPDFPMAAEDSDIEATRMLNKEEQAAILSDEQTAAETEELTEAADDASCGAEPAAATGGDMPEGGEDTENLPAEAPDDTEEAAPDNDDNTPHLPGELVGPGKPASIEETLVMPNLAAEAAAVAIGADMLDKIALEETRIIKNTDIAEEISAPIFGEGAEETVDTAKGDGLLPEAPLPFGPKMAWLAIPGYQPSEVIAALRLGDVAPANWTKGLGEAYADNNQVFVTPTLSGWVLVVGKTLWQKADMNRSAENIQWLKEVGRLFGNACFFSTMRGLGNHGWVGIRGGNIVRAYGYSGELQELIWLLGEPTEEEIAINPAFANEMQERREPNFRPIVPDEKMVLAMAAAWSVDVSFSSRRYPPDFGFLGTLA